MSLFPVAGSRIYIGGVLADQNSDFDASDFSGETWVEIDGWETMGGFGDKAETITSQLINRNRDIKQKGTRNAGQMQNNFSIIRDDAGQIALRAAEATNNNYAFRILFDDTPASGSAPTPTTKYFIGLVTTADETGGAANTIQMLSGTVEINSNIVTVAAATGD